METGWMTAAGLGIGLLLCCIPAIAGFVLIQIKYRKSVLPFFMGAAAFIVSQLLLRTPLLQLVLPRFQWYVAMSVQNYYGYWIFLGMTAGIFEETARWICFRYLLKKRRRFSDGIVFGLGHGGAEALLITGIGYLNNFIVAWVLAGGGNLTQSFGIERKISAGSFGGNSGPWDYRCFHRILAGGRRNRMGSGRNICRLYGSACGLGIYML